MIAPATPRRGAQARVHDRALVLRRFRYGESSLVVHLLTPSRGRVSVLAKGAYRAKSGYCGVLDFFDTLELSWRNPVQSELGTLSTGAVQRRRKRVATDLERYRAGLALLELAGIGSREQHAEAELFQLTAYALDALEECVAEPALVCSVYDLKFLQLQGLVPALDHCALCGKVGRGEAEGRRIPFSAHHGGRLCGSCAEQSDRHIEQHSPGTLRVARSLLATPFPQIVRINLDSARTGELMGFVRRFLEYHLETRPRTPPPRPGPQQRPPIRRT